MRHHVVSILVVATAVACGSDDRVEHDAAPNNGGPDAAATNVVEVDVPSAADFAAYRSGDGPWHTPALGSGSNGLFYTLTVADDYLLVLVCDDAGSGTAFDSEAYGFTFKGDGPVVYAGCSEQTGFPPTPMTQVTGTMLQPGSVQVGGLGSSATTADWTYSADVPSGLHDVLAIGTDGLALWDKGRAFDGATATGPTLDTSTGVALLHQQLTTTGLDGTTPQVLDQVVATDTATVFSGTGDDILLMPPSELGTGDLQMLELDAFAGVQDQEAFETATGPTMPVTHFAMLPPLTAVTIHTDASAYSASWSTLPVSSYDEVVLLADAAGAPGTQQMFASSSWIAARAATTLGFDTSAPGYQDAWTVAASGGFAEVHVDATDAATGVYYSTWTGTMEFATDQPRRALRASTRTAASLATARSARGSRSPSASPASP
jgi:hypothetical protein